MSCTICPTDLVTGNLTGPLSFEQAIISQTYDQSAGIWYIGCATGAGNFTIAKAQRTTNITPSFSPLAASLSIQDFSIDFLKLAKIRGVISQILVAVPRSISVFRERQLTAFTTNGSNEQTSPELNDASGVSVTQGIVNIAPNQDMIFTAVRPNGGNFGDSDGGVALVSIDSKTLVLSTRDATTGSIGNRALELASNSPELKGDSGGSPVIFQSGNSENRVALYWDPVLERFYLGVRITTGMVPTDIGKSIVLGRTTASNSLAYEPIAPDSAIDPTENEIVVATGSDLSLTVKDVTILHASTGPSYLIVNGKRAPSDLVGNVIRALPLVNNPSNSSIHGTLANKNSSLIENVFISPATSIGDLVTDDDPAAIVGATNLPLDPDQDIGQIVVLGDAIYVSIATPQDSTQASGLFYSEALFDETGKIVHWTPWTKRVFPFLGFPNELASIKFFTVDAVTSKVWAVNGEALDIDNSNKIVRVTTWEKDTSSSSLVGALNQTNIALGACSVLDLDQSTHGFACNTPHRYALFGAPETVVFTRISQAFQINNINSPQNVVDDFSLPANLLQTHLGTNTGAVRVMEFSRRPSSDMTNYFFAGTNKGLFVFTTPDGTGFNTSDLSRLDLPPFSNGRWSHISSIEGTVLDIKTTGNMLYILTYSTTCETPIQTTLYRIPFASSIDTMFNPAAQLTIAASSTGIFTTAPYFSGMQIVTTSSDGSEEQVILATNNGLFQSTRIGGVQSALNQTDARWSTIDTNDKLFFNGIAAPDNTSLQPITCTGPTGPTGPLAPPSTVWPFNLSDPTRCNIFDRSDINQVTSSTTMQPYALNPEDFNSIEVNNAAFNSLYPITFFWTDGGRRIFIVRRPEDSSNTNQLLSLPFDTTEWNIDSANSPIIRDSLFTTFDSFNWITLIGVTGQLLAGTNKGIIALQ
jgi:hypothetical protein